MPAELFCKYHVQVVAGGQHDADERLERLALQERFAALAVGFQRVAELGLDLVELFDEMHRLDPRLIAAQVGEHFYEAFGLSELIEVARRLTMAADGIDLEQDRFANRG